MSRNTVDNIILTNPNNHPLVAKVLACIGTHVQLTSNFWGDDDDDVDRDYKFPDEVTSVGVIGDNAIGAVTGAYMLNDNLILIANYGDDGDYEYNVNNSTNSIPLGIVKLESLSVD